ncbi:MAG: MFS transporter [Acidimicrobiales bacterium]|nr:MFS transporter [Acidimicrobiales bacterium]
MTTTEPRREPSQPTVEDVEDADLDGDRPFAAGTARAALSYRSFRRVYTGSLVSNIGTWMQNVVLGQYAYALTKSPTFVSLMVFAQLGPLLLLAVVGGALADRFDRRKLLIGVSVWQAAFAFALAYVGRDADPSKALLVAVVFLIGVGQALAGPVFASALPALVERRDLSGAVSLQSTNMNLSRVIGAPLGAFVFSRFGVSWVFVLNGLSYFAIVAAVSTVHLPKPRPDPAAPRGWRQLLGGVRVARRDPIVARILITVALFSFFCLTFIGQMPTLAERNLGIDETSTAYGWLYFGFALGAMTGALSIGTVLAGRRLDRVVVAGLTGFAALLAAFSLWRAPGPAYPTALVMGAFYFATITSLSTLLQHRLADAERGRVMALWIMAFGGTVPVGVLVAGPVIEATSVTAVMLVGAVVAALLAAWNRAGLVEPDRHVDPAR